MANTIKELSDGDITRKALQILHNNLVFCKTINRQYDSRFAVSGAKNGGTLLIRNPNQFTVRSGAVMDTQDVTEDTQTLTLATQRGVDINFSSAELTLSLDDFSTRILEPAMSRLAAEVESVVIADCYKDVNNMMNTTFGTKPVLVDVIGARAKLQQNMAPTSNRVLLTDALAANSIIADSKSLYNPSGEISRQYTEGLLGRIYGFQHYETEMTPTFTNGTYADSDTGTVDISPGIVSGTATIAIDSCTTAGTLTNGQIFTIAGVYDVNPETKDVYTHLKQWVVTELTTASAGAIAACAVSPTPYTSGAKQNCSVVTDSATAAVLTETAGGSGTASTGFRNSLAYHKDAFTVVFADLVMPKGQDMAHREVHDGISLRLVRDYDIINDKFPCRIDVLFGQKATRPEWACRLSS